MQLRTKLVAATIAGAALFVGAILPAEYGLDPTGLGGKLGLTGLSGEPTAPAACETVMRFNIGEYDPAAEQIARSVQGLIHLEETAFRSDVIDIEIEDFGEVEYKLILPADTTFVYSWEVLEAVGDGVYYDFHGHPSTEDAPNYPDGFEMAYSRGEGTVQNGSFTAPFPGYHGFYFMNIEEGPITVRLTVSGFWEDHKEMFRAVNGKVIVNEAF